MTVGINISYRLPPYRNTHDMHLKLIYVYIIYLGEVSLDNFGLKQKTTLLTQAPFSSRTSSRYLHGPSRTAEKLRLHLPLHGTLHGTFADLHGFLLFEKSRVRWWVR